MYELKNGISRRDFLKGTAAAAASLTAASLLGGCQSAADGTAAATEGAATTAAETAAETAAATAAETAAATTAAAETVAETAAAAADNAGGGAAAKAASVYSLNPQDYDYRDPNTDFKTLFSSWKFGGLTLNHRMVKSAAGSDTGKNEQEICAYYSNFAKGGVEMVWVEDFVNALPHFGRPNKPNREDAPLAQIAKAVHDAGGYVGYQLSCMGQKFSGFDPATAAQYESAYAEHLSAEEVAQLQQDFIDGAKYMQEQGFDAVEINAAGNNIGQAFFSRQRNHREDQYGPQSFENRARFVGEIIKGIKGACGADFPVQVLINGIEENDINLGDRALSTTVEENCEICRVLEEYGASSLHVRLGVFRMHVNQFASDLYFTGYGIEGTAANGVQFDFSRHFQGKLMANHSGCGMMLNVAKEIKEAVNIPVGTVTYMDPAHAPKLFEDALKEGKCDFLLMTRPLTVDPEYVNKLREGRLDEIAPCTRCLHCHFDYDDEGKVYEHCRVNACTQRAYREAMPEGDVPTPASAPKKVMVVGGGPAGMEAARIAAQRGHTVTLYEKRGALGGLLPFAAMIKGPHENLEDLCKYLVRQQELKGVTVVTGTEVTAELVKQEAPDAVILAAGGQRPEMGLKASGATNVISIEEITAAEIGEHVTILGGNVQAVDAAQYLVAQGKHVTIVTPEAKGMLDKGQSAWVKTFTLPMLYARGTQVWPNASVTAVGEGTVTIRGELGIDLTIDCDTVIDASDLLRNVSLQEELADFEVIPVGDCNRPYNIAEAIAAGNLAARKI